MNSSVNAPNRDLDSKDDNGREQDCDSPAWHLLELVEDIEAVKTIVKYNPPILDTNSGHSSNDSALTRQLGPLDLPRKRGDASK